MSAVFRTIGVFIKQDPNLVLYNSMIGRANYDSPTAIFNYLKANPKYARLEHVWAFNNPDAADYIGCKKIKMDSFQYFITALRAGYWITNVNIERGLSFKKKRTRYLNTWHGVAFNHIGNDVAGRSDYDSRKVNFICYESEYSKKILMRALGAEEKSMLASGLPRNDELYSVNPDEVVRIKKSLGILSDRKVILYAPTWRDSSDMGKDYVLSPPINFEYWKESLGDKYVILLRTHHLTTKLMNVKFDEFVIDVTSYPRINDLFKVSDILISDYSACIADFSILERPVICFAYDYDEYKTHRGLYIDLEKEMPNGVFKNERDIINHILTMNYDAECDKARKLKAKFTNIGGNATQICVEALFQE